MAYHEPNEVPWLLRAERAVIHYFATHDGATAALLYGGVIGCATWSYWYYGGY